MFLRDSLLRLKKSQFLFEELVKRDFKKKYKGTLLGIGWSVLQPLLMLLVLKLVFEQLFGRTIPHYTIFLPRVQQPVPLLHPTYENRCTQTRRDSLPDR